MKYSKENFIIPNIANVPCTKERIIKIIKFFENNTYDIKTMLYNNYDEALGVTAETFRKTINHSNLIGIVENNNGIYRLSKISKDFYYSNDRIDKYVLTLIENNVELSYICKVILTILNIFPNTIRYKTLYSMFSLVGKNRLDKSSIETVGRNLRPILSLLSMAGVIKKEHSNVVIIKSEDNKLKMPNIQSISNYYMKDIIETKDISKYMENYFEKNIIKNILKCLATYETSNYIWAKSSLYKNNGEIENLYGEFIMTVMRKGSRQR